MGGCARCMTRVPYGTLIATILCCAGVVAFLICLFRAVRLTLEIFKNVFKYDLEWLSEVQVIFIIVGAFMGVMAITLLVVGIFSTGATRSKIYRGWKSRVGGRISSALCMVIVYVLHLIWLAMTCCLVVVVFVFYVWKKLCENSIDYIDLTQFHFLFPNGTEIDTLRIRGNRKAFCTDTVYAIPYFMISFIASVLIIISLINYIMCLTANYTRIKDQEKFKDLQELQYLQDSEMGTLPKDRF